MDIVTLGHEYMATRWLLQLTNSSWVFQVVC